MPPTHKTHSFTLILSGDGELTEGLQDALFEAGCDDALLGSRGGVLYLDFDREGASLDDAVLSAIGDVERAGTGRRVVRVESGDLVTAGEIARRVGRSRESIRLYALGRRGPGGFPAPAARAKSRSPLYRWSDVAGWLAGAAAAGPELIPPAAGAVELINATLDVRRLAPAVPAAEHVFRSLGVPTLGMVAHPPQGAKTRPRTRTRKKESPQQIG
jgi:hypothetical protein